MRDDEICSFAREKIATTLEQRSERGEFDRALWGDIVELGITGMLIDEEYGGGRKKAGELAEYGQFLSMPWG